MTILGMSIYQVLEFFLIYAFLGWCVEVVYAAVTTGTVINRGFLNGPVCPIYGFGVVAIFGMIALIGDAGADAQAGVGESLPEANAAVIFIGGVILATLIELIGGWALDRIFHTRWWDYSKRPFNFHGYICLQFSLLWGLGILLVVRVVHPAIAHASVQLLPERIGWILLGIFYTIFAADLIVSVMIMIGLNQRIEALNQVQAEMRRFSDDLSTRLGEQTIETGRVVGETKVQAALARAEFKDELEETQKDLENDLAKRRAAHQRRIEAAREELHQRVQAHQIFGAGRLLRAFPDMENHRYPGLVQELRDAALKRKDSAAHPAEK